MLLGMNKKRALLILLILSTFLINVLFPVLLVVNIKTSYTKSFETFHDFENPERAEEEFGELLKYTTFRRAALSPDFFSEEDILHMRDVRVLLIYVYLFFGLSAACLIFTKIDGKEKLKARAIGSAASLALVLLIGLSALLFPFDSISTVFHKIFFRNDYWLLDPRTSNLIKFFPQEALQIQAAFIILAIMIISAVQLFLTWKEQKKKK